MKTTMFDRNGNLVSVFVPSKADDVVYTNGSKLGAYVPEMDGDDEDPDSLFTGTWSCLLTAICNGQVDPIALAARELANRGMDVNGTWIGFDAAKSYDYFQNRK